MNIRKATVHPRATENIEPIISLIGKLVDNGYAYASNGDVYFRTHREGHNLDRARNQFALVADMEKKLEQMNEIVRALAAQC